MIVVIAVFFYSQNEKTKQPTIVISEPILGCYVATLNKDVYNLEINSQAHEKVSGTLTFNNYQKDSSSGTFSGTYKDSILLGTYAFQSEGVDSVMQVIFKKVGNDFTRGYGNMSTTTNEFVDLDAVQYDDSAVFKSEPCVKNQ